MADDRRDDRLPGQIDQRPERSEQRSRDGRIGTLQIMSGAEREARRDDAHARAAKVLFNFPMHRLPARVMNAPGDFPSIWNQAPRKGMQLHWDGNNTMVEERNKSAAFGAGTTPPTLDTQAIGRIETWLLTREQPQYPYPIDAAKAERGSAIYKQYCAGCHGAGPRDFSGEFARRLNFRTHDNRSTLLVLRRPRHKERLNFRPPAGRCQVRPPRRGA